MVEKVYLTLGSNRDNRLWYLFQAIRYLSKTPSVDILNISSIYETEPYGVTNQRDFLNAVVEIDTSFSPGHLLQYIKFIEKKVGRISRGFWASREIDIDVLTYGDKIINLPWLTIPHLELHKRRFVLIPFLEIASAFVIPKQNKTIEFLLEACQDKGRVAEIIPRIEIQEQIKEITSRVEILS